MKTITYKNISRLLNEFNFNSYSKNIAADFFNHIFLSF